MELDKGGASVCVRGECCIWERVAQEGGRGAFRKAFVAGVAVGVSGVSGEELVPSDEEGVGFVEEEVDEVEVVFFWDPFHHKEQSSEGADLFHVES
eukprot:109828-Rhodomonas_salina.3